MRHSGRVQALNAMSWTDFETQYMSDLPWQPPGSSQTPGALTRPSIDVHCQTVALLSPQDRQACFQLIAQSSQRNYEKSSRGWRPGAKRREMLLPDLRYLLCYEGSVQSDATVAFDVEMEPSQSASMKAQSATVKASTSATTPVAKSRVLGFASFMLTYEDGLDVIYIYEIHLDQALRGQGLGKHLMHLIETIGKRTGMVKAMLTVFRANAAACQFYARLGYELDDYSPEARVLRNGAIKESDYLILSKRLQPD